MKFYVKCVPWYFDDQGCVTDWKFFVCTSEDDCQEFDTFDEAKEYCAKENYAIILKNKEETAPA